MAGNSTLKTERCTSQDFKGQHHELHSVSVPYEADFIAYFQNFILSYILYVLHVTKSLFRTIQRAFKSAVRTVLLIFSAQAPGALVTTTPTTEGSEGTVKTGGKIKKGT